MISWILRALFFNVDKMFYIGTEFYVLLRNYVVFEDRIVCVYSCTKYGIYTDTCVKVVNALIVELAAQMNKIFENI